MTLPDILLMQPSCVGGESSCRGKTSWLGGANGMVGWRWEDRDGQDNGPPVGEGFFHIATPPHGSVTLLSGRGGALLSGRVPLLSCT